MIDLHIHTTVSDGKCTPAQILDEATKIGLSMISVTDHNETSAYREIRQCRAAFAGKIVPGTEISCAFKGFTMELLGYGIDPEKCLGLLRDSYHPELYRQKERLCALKMIRETGFRVEKDRFEENIRMKGVKRALYIEYLAFREENRHLLSNSANGENYVNFFREEMYHPGNALSFDYASYQPSAEDALSIIHQCGGLAFLAHPFISFPNDRAALEKAALCGADGVECYYSTFTPAQSEYLIGFCEKHGLYHSGGSDFHGESRPNQLGTGLGNLSIQEDFVAGWINRIETI